MIEVREACCKKDMRRFIKFPWKIYKGDPHWVPPLLMEQKSVTFNKNKHPFFEFGEAAFFLAFKDGTLAGRISAHINHNHNKHFNAKDGFFGFFECIDDQETADALFKAAELWLKERGMTKVIGPESYTIYDEIGILVEGRDSEPLIPVILHTYTPAYYPALIEKAGYSKEIDWYAYKVTSDVEIKPVFLKVKDRLERQGFVFRTLDKKNLDSEAEHFKKLINSAWDENWGHIFLTDKQIDMIKSFFKLFLDERFVFLVEYNGEVIGVSITLPDINPAIQKMNGRLFPFGWWHLMRAKKNATGLRTFLFGVLPEFRNKGIDAALVIEAIITGRETGFSWSDCSLLVETNRKVIDPVEKWGGRNYRTYRLYSRQL